MSWCIDCGGGGWICVFSLFSFFVVLVVVGCVLVPVCFGWLVCYICEALVYGSLYVVFFRGICLFLFVCVWGGFCGWFCCGCFVGIFVSCCWGLVFFFFVFVVLFVYWCCIDMIRGFLVFCFVVVCTVCCMVLFSI